MYPIIYEIFKYLKYLSIFFYISVKIGFFKSEVTVMHLLEDFIQILVAIFCVYIFWPFRKKHLINKHDIGIGFSAGLFLLASLDIFKHNKYFKYFKNLLELAE